MNIIINISQIAGYSLPRHNLLDEALLLISKVSIFSLAIPIGGNVAGRISPVNSGYIVLQKGCHRQRRNSNCVLLYICCCGCVTY